VASPHESKNKKLLSNFLFVLVLSFFILIARWPALLSPMMNVDEGWFIAAAMKLVKDPIFWRSADGGSTGPLNVYLLSLPALFGIRIEYASARVIALILAIIFNVCLYYSMCCLYRKRIARLALLPVATTTALTTIYDYAHYNSEILSVALLSTSWLMLCSYYRIKSVSSSRLIFLLGLSLGVIPYTKMQGVPVAFAISIIFLHILWRKSENLRVFFKELYCFGFGSIFSSLFIIFYLRFFSLNEAFWNSYIKTNLLFYSSGGPVYPGPRLKLAQFISMIESSELAVVLLSIAGIICISGIPFLLGSQKFLNSHNENKALGYNDPDTFMFVYYSFIFMLSSVYIVVKPGNPFTHYLLFLFVPSGFVIGVFLGELERISGMIPDFSKNKIKIPVLAIVITFIISNSFLQAALSLKSGNPYISQRKVFSENYISPLTKTILRYASPGEYMAVWGWSPEVYIESGLIQATRDGVPFWQITPNPLNKYFLDRYLDDISKSNPSLFVDTVTTGRFHFTDRKAHGHEAFPIINQFVENNYILNCEIDGVRIYFHK
jgi:hypothetical protein